MKLVAYYRVSTDKQGKSGPGLEAQQAAVQNYARSVGPITREFTEVESGKRSDRPVLAEALRYAKRTRATLVIAKLDRLARNVHFLSGLMESGVDFVACDNPNANKLTIHILAAVAEDEARRISERTKAALAAYKAGNRVSKRIRDKYPDGVPDRIIRETAGKLGGSLPQCRNLKPEDGARGCLVSARVRRGIIAEFDAQMAPLISLLRREGFTLQGIADRLNEQGEQTRGGCLWTPTQVKRVLDRAEKFVTD